MNDTSPEIRAFLIRRFQTMSAHDKLKKTSNMFATGRRFAEIAVKRLNRDLEGIELKIAAFRWMYRHEISAHELDKIEERMRRQG